MRRFAGFLMLAGMVVAVMAGTSFACGGGGSGGHGSHGSSDQHQKDMKHADAGTGQEAFLRHGGQLTRTKGHNFETVFAADGIRVYAYSPNLAPALLGKEVAGKVTMSFADGATREASFVAGLPPEGERTAYFCPMHPQVAQMSPGVCALCEGMELQVQDRLFAPADLSGVDPGSMYAVFEIAGLPGGESKVTYAETFRLSYPPTQAPTAPRASGNSGAVPGDQKSEPQARHAHNGMGIGTHGVLVGVGMGALMLIGMIL